MEQIFKIKTKCQPDINSQYPSERRYSSSIVLGLSIVMIQFSLCSILMGTLIIHKMNVLNTEADISQELHENINRLHEKLERDIEYSQKSYLHYYINIPALLCASCYIMATGDILAFTSGMFAWKKWYIDHNITLFFLSCSFSTLTSSISLVSSILITYNIKFDTYEDYSSRPHEISPISLSLAINIIVLSMINAVWSFLATKLAYEGMRNSYPDDIITRRVKVTSIQKGSHNSKSNIPIEVINSFAVGKMIHYLPKIESHDLPKQETKAEFRRRVDEFLGDHDAELEVEMKAEDKSRKNVN